MRHFRFGILILMMCGFCTVARAAETTMTFIKKDRAILAIGQFTKTTPEDFIKFTKTNTINIGDTVYLDSLGGDVESSLSLGRIFRGYQLNTAVDASMTPTNPGACASACVFTFMAGVKRSITGDNDLFVHQVRVVSSSPVTEDETRSALLRQYAQLNVYFSEMGISHDFVTDMMLTPSNDIKPISLKRAMMLNLDNTTRGSAAMSSVEAYVVKAPWRKEIAADGQPTHSFYMGNRRVMVIGCRGDIVHMYIVLPKSLQIHEDEARYLHWHFSTDNRVWDVAFNSIFTYDNDTVLDIAVGNQFLNALYNAQEFNFYADGIRTALYGVSPNNLRNNGFTCKGH